MINPAYGNMGTNVGYFYSGLTLVILILAFVFVPETARLKLEQIDDYFQSGVPAWKTSLGRNKRIAEKNVLEVGVDVATGEVKQVDRDEDEPVTSIQQSQPFPSWIVQGHEREQRYTSLKISLVVQSLP